MILTSQWRPADQVQAEASTRVRFSLKGRRWELDSADVSFTPFEHCSPVRSFPAWPGKRHYSGSLWMSRGHRHVGFESFAERSCLLELDRSADVVDVCSQPMWIKWLDEDGSDHVPDYFARLSDGGALLVDVRPLSRIDEAAHRKFSRTAQLCDELGWQYVVYDAESPIRDANLRFLARYTPRIWGVGSSHVPPSGCLGTVADVASMLEEDGDGRGLARCYGMIWSGDLTVDLDQPLRMATLVFREEKS